MAISEHWGPHGLYDDSPRLPWTTVLSTHGSFQRLGRPSFNRKTHISHRQELYWNWLKVYTSRIFGLYALWVPDTVHFTPRRGRYRFISDCYVHGLMEGYALDLGFPEE